MNNTYSDPYLRVLSNVLEFVLFFTAKPDDSSSHVDSAYL